jgi:chorismate mutase/prephenate dehydratase
MTLALKSARIAYLGPKGTYSQVAAEAFVEQFSVNDENSESILQPLAEIEDIFTAVVDGTADFGVVPLENSTEGSILPTLDAMANTTVIILAEYLLRIEHCLLASVGQSLSSLKGVAAHPQALGQCRQWLKTNLPHCDLLPLNSNAEAALLARQEPNMAAIAGAAAADLYELEILHFGIEDKTDNTTRFVLITANKRLRESSSGQDKTSLILKVHNQPGTLFRALEPFYRQGINLIKLESRPSKKTIWSYFFYIDLEGHISDPDVAAALNELTRLGIDHQILGSYPAKRMA